MRVWPIDDVSKAETVSHPSRLGSAFWRPGPTAPYEVIRTVGPNVEIFRYPTGPSTTLYTGTEQSVGAVAVRPDGSAVLISQSGGGPPPPTARFILVDVATRQATDVFSGAVPENRFLPRGVLLR